MLGTDEDPEDDIYCWKDKVDSLLQRGAVVSKSHALLALSAGFSDYVRPWLAHDPKIFETNDQYTEKIFHTLSRCSPLEMCIRWRLMDFTGNIVEYVQDVALMKSILWAGYGIDIRVPCCMHVLEESDGITFVEWVGAHANSIESYQHINDLFATYGCVSTDILKEDFFLGLIGQSVFYYAQMEEMIMDRLAQGVRARQRFPEFYNVSPLELIGSMLHRVDIKEDPIKLACAQSVRTLLLLDGVSKHYGVKQLLTDDTRADQDGKVIDVPNRTQFEQEFWQNWQKLPEELRRIVFCGFAQGNIVK